MSQYPNPLISCPDCGYPGGKHHAECPGQPFPSEVIENVIKTDQRNFKASQLPAQVTNLPTEQETTP